MLLARIYRVLWLLGAAIAGVLYLTDSFTLATTMVLGFTASILAGAGLLVVYPAVMSERVLAESKAPNTAERKRFATGELQSVG